MSGGHVVVHVAYRYKRVLIKEQNRRSQADLAGILGSRSRTSEILAGRRGLSIEMIRTISRESHIPADLLIPRCVAAWPGP